MTERQPPSRLPGQTSTLLRFAWQQLAGRRAPDTKLPALAQFTSLAPALESLPPAVKPRLARASVSATDEGWRSTSMRVKRGESFSVFADGTVWISKLLSVGAEARLALWLRIAGHGPIRKMLDNVTSFDAWDDGEIELCLKPPGEWADENGNFDPAIPRTGATGGVDAIVAVWPGLPAEGMSALSRIPAFAEMAAAASERTAPQAWSYLWRLGDGAIYDACACEGGPAIHVHTHGDVGILQHDVDISLDGDTELEWRWRVEQLPSSLPEHIQPTHDYLSIAVEFENGLDLTYYWSASLPEGTIYRCPLPWWSERETHWVVKSGTEQLGSWHSERRRLKADYERAIGGPVPERIVRVWLIANSVFQRGHGIADFSGIALTHAGRRVTVL